MFILEFYQIMPIKERANKNRSRSAVKERLRAINCLRREGGHTAGGNWRG